MSSPSLVLHLSTSLVMLVILFGGMMMMTGASEIPMRQRRQIDFDTIWDENKEAAIVDSTAIVGDYDDYGDSRNFASASASTRPVFNPLAPGGWYGNAAAASVSVQHPAPAGYGGAYPFYVYNSTGFIFNGTYYPFSPTTTTTTGKPTTSRYGGNIYAFFFRDGTNNETALPEDQLLPDAFDPVIAG